MRQSTARQRQPLTPIEFQDHTAASRAAQKRKKEYVDMTRKIGLVAMLVLALGLGSTAFAKSVSAAQGSQSSSTSTGSSTASTTAPAKKKHRKKKKAAKKTSAKSSSSTTQQR
jgi:hypothetical protein